MTHVNTFDAKIHNTGDTVFFKKMHSLQNDFILIETNQEAGTRLLQDATFIKRISQRRDGVGCDQLLFLTPSLDAGVHADITIYNCDGAEVEACGNGTRCAGFLLAQKYGIDTVRLRTKAGVLTAHVVCDREVEVTQGVPSMLRDEPLDLTAFGFEEGYATSMGNPHLVVPVEADFDPQRLQYVGPRLESHAFFPKKTNVEFVVAEGSQVRLWVWERGAGRTKACASGACAAVYALLTQELLQCAPTTPVLLEGGEMWVTHKDDGTFAHRAEVVPVFDGHFSL